MRTGNLAAVTSAIGDQLNELGGIRFTRLIEAASAGDLHLKVETTHGWPEAGRVVVQGTVYDYESKAIDRIYNLSWDDAGTLRNGIKDDRDAGTPVVDFSRTFSAIDQTKGQTFTDTAEGLYLSTVGRNLGIDRPPGLVSDVAFRAVIKALSYAPRGTLLAIETALTAFFGADNFEVWEDFPTHPSTVFIKLKNGVALHDDPDGLTYLLKRETEVLDTGTSEIELSENPMTVQGVRLADERQSSDLQSARPSDFDEVRYVGDAGIPIWTFQGDDEAGDVTPAVPTGCRFNVAAPDTAYYLHTARLRPESNGRFNFVFRIRAALGTGGSSGNQVAMRVRDGARDIGLGMIGNGGPFHFVRIGLIDTAGAHLDGYTLIEQLKWYQGELRKNGRTGRVEFWLNGSFIQALPAASFGATTMNDLRFGALDALAVDFDVAQVGYDFSTPTDYWNERGTDGEVDSGSPDALSVPSAPFQVGVDESKFLRTETQDDKPVNNGVWKIVSIGGTTDVVLEGPPRPGAFLESANPSRISIALIDDAFTYPDDVGKRIRLTSGSGNDGEYEIARLLDPETEDEITGDFTERTNLCEVMTPPAGGFITETGVQWQLLPNWDTESGLLWEMAGAGTVVDNVATVPDNPPLDLPVGYEVIVEVVFSSVLSGQILASADVANVPSGTWHPAYLPTHAMGPYAAFLDDLTVAGVIPELIVE